MNEDKKLKSQLKKFGKYQPHQLTWATVGMQQLQDIDEVNMFKDDNTVVHLKRPQSKLSNTPSNFFV